MDCELGDREHNLSHALGLLRGLPRGVQMACLPELFTTGYQLSPQLSELAEPIPGPTTERLAETGRAQKLGIVGGIAERAGDVIYDSAFLIGPDGSLAGIYRKTHLYPPERDHFRPGDRLETYELGGVRVGVAICFEHAFPPIFTTLALGGAQVIFIPSAVPVGYEYLLDLRTRARAQDNQFFVVAANRTGEDGGIHWCGHSQIVSPKGEVLAKAEREERAVVAELDLSLIEQERAQEPVLSSLRPKLYSWGGDALAG
jgi:predicted amidohydrolase